MRPLTVRMVCSSGPLLWRGLPVWGCSGGGESRLRGVGAELDGGLVGGGAEVGKQVADLLLAAVDDGPGRSPVDGGSDIPAEFLKALAQLFAKSISGQGRFGRHGVLLAGAPTSHPAGSAELPSQSRRSRMICHTLLRSAGHRKTYPISS